MSPASSIPGAEPPELPPSKCPLARHRLAPEPRREPSGGSAQYGPLACDSRPPLSPAAQLSA